MNPFPDNAEALQQRAIALIKPLIPPDAEDRVHREDVAPAETANSFRVDRQAGGEILAILESEPTDGKWDCCYHLLTSRGIGSTCSGILFTDFADTAEYLQYLAKSRGLNVAAIRGAVRLEDRDDALNDARNNPTLLIVTGAVEGVDCAFSNQTVHYDVPWNPRAFLQRAGRIERLGNLADAYDHFFVLEQNAASKVLAGLLEKVQAIENEWK